MESSSSSASRPLHHTPTKSGAGSKRKSPDSKAEGTKAPKRPRVTKEFDLAQSIFAPSTSVNSPEHKRRAVRRKNTSQSVKKNAKHTTTPKDKQTQVDTPKDKQAQIDITKDKQAQVDKWLEISKLISSDINFCAEVQSTFFDLNPDETQYLSSIESPEEREKFFEETIKAQCLQQTVDSLFEAVKSFETKNCKKASFDDLSSLMEIWSKELGWDIQTIGLNLIVLKRALSADSPLNPDKDHHRLAIYLACRCKTEKLKTHITDLIQSMPVPQLNKQSMSISDPLEISEAEDQARQLLKGNWKRNIKQLNEEAAPIPKGLSKPVWITANNFIKIWPNDDFCELSTEFNTGEEDMMNSEYTFFSLLQAFGPDSTLNNQEKEHLALLIDLGISHKKTILKIGKKNVDWRDWFLLFEPGIHSLKSGMIIPDDYTLVHDKPDSLLSESQQDFSPATSSPKPSKSSGATKELKKMQAQIEKLTNKLDEKKSLITSLKSELAQSKKEIKRLNQQLELQDKGLRPKQSHIDELSKKLEANEAAKASLIKNQSKLIKEGKTLGDQVNSLTKDNKKLRQTVETMQKELAHFRAQVQVQPDPEQNIPLSQASSKESSETDSPSGSYEPQQAQTQKEAIEECESILNSVLIIINEQKQKKHNKKTTESIDRIKKQIPTFKPYIEKLKKSDKVDGCLISALKLSLINAKDELEGLNS